MNRLIVYGLVPWLALWGASASRAQEGPEKAKAKEGPKPSSTKADASQASPAERYRDVLKAHAKAQREFVDAYRAAKTDEDRTKVLDTKRPDEQAFADRMLKIVEDAPKDPVAVEALIWVAMNSPGPKADKALKDLISDHVADPKIGSLCARMVYEDSPESEKFLREVLARNTDHDTKGQACLALGQRLKMAADRAEPKEKALAMSKEAETLLERVTKEFAGVKAGNRTLGDIAKNELNEIRNLGIGKVAPEITGEDIDGKPMKLTDFRGKVVVLDFWGDW